MYHLKTASWRSAVDMMDVRIKTSLLGRRLVAAGGRSEGRAMLTREAVTVVDVDLEVLGRAAGGVGDDEGRGREGISRWREMP